MTRFLIRYYDERGSEICTIEVTGEDKAAIPLDAQYLRVSSYVSAPE